MVAFVTDDLKAKYGFADGDMLYKIARRAGYSNHRTLLECVVEKFVLPLIQQKLEVFYYSGIHNPIRVDTVDGVEVEEEHCPPITPEVVHVTRAQIYELIREQKVAAAKSCNQWRY